MPKSHLRASAPFFSLSFERVHWFAIASLLALVALAPDRAYACACGCGIFDIGGNVLTGMPVASDTGVSVWFRYSYMNQSRNQEGTSGAPASDNRDKDINTSFYTVGGEYMIDSDWTVMAELPIYARHLRTTDDGGVFGPAGSLYTGKITDLGDMELSASYTGLAADMSSGLSFGVKLPTGNSSGPTGPLGGTEFDHDSRPGTGSTDLMLGAYHVGTLSADEKLGYFVQGRYQFAVSTQDSYRPGNEFDGAFGLTYDIGPQGPLADITSLLQLLGSYRDRDGGANSDPLNSGYTRLLIAPGIEMRLKQFRLYADVEFPILQDVNAAASPALVGTAGQLVASALYKAQIAYDF